MLENDANRPPLELRLTDELARCESMLSSLSLPASRVQRDELMYRAGWAAAEARLPVSAPQIMEQASSARRTYRRKTFVWSLTSAVLAASLAVAITANFQGSAAVPQAAIPEMRSADRAEMSVEAAPPLSRQPQPIPREIARKAAVDWTAPLLVMRERALRQRWDDPWIVADRSFDASSPKRGVYSPPKTSQEILRELIPEPSARGVSADDPSGLPFRWPRTFLRLGDTT